MKNETVHAAVDVGTSKVCTFIGHSNGMDDMQVLGVGVVPSRGMQKGSVSTISDVHQAIEASIKEAEAQAGIRISSVSASISGTHMSYVNSRAALGNRKYDSPVSPDDLKQIMRACYTDHNGVSSRILHVIPRDYSVDGSWGIRDPIGMFGSSVEVESHVVMGDPTSVDNLVEAFRRTKVRLKGLIMGPLASAEAVLSDDEREMGTVLADIGGGTTDVAIFMDGSIWHTKIIPVGGFQFTRDISIAFTTFFLAAEDAKLDYGDAIPSSVDPDEAITLPGFGGQPATEISRETLCQVINERMDELLRIVQREVKQSGLSGTPPGGLVLTGGTAKLPGLEELASEIWPGPVRIGVPTASAWVPQNLEDPAFATGLGLLHWDAKQHQGGSSNGNGHSKQNHRGKHWLGIFKRKSQV